MLKGKLQSNLLADTVYITIAGLLYPKNTVKYIRISGKQDGY
jgi:hypothetical protein